MTEDSDPDITIKEKRKKGQSKLKEWKFEVGT